VLVIKRLLTVLSVRSGSAPNVRKSMGGTALPSTASALRCHLPPGCLRPSMELSCRASLRAMCQRLRRSTSSVVAWAGHVLIIQRAEESSMAHIQCV
jgi:hypothetical protein